MYIAGTSFDRNGTSSEIYQSHSTSSTVLSKVINSDSTMERAIKICFEDFHDTTTPSSVNAYLLIDLNSS